MNRFLLRKSLLAIAISGFIGSLCITSCSKKSDSDVSPSKGYLVSFIPDGGGNPVVDVIADVTKGEYTIAKAREAIITRLVDPANTGRMYLDYNYTEFQLNSAGDVEVKRTINDAGKPSQGGLVDAGNGKLIGLREYPGGTPENMIFTIDLVDPESFSLLKTGTVTIAVPSGKALWINGIGVHGDKLVLTYYFHDPDTYVAEDLARVIILNASTLAYEKSITDTRTAALGFGDRGQMEYNGDLYISSSNSDWWGLNEKMPAGVLCIRKGQTVFDPGYFLNITAATGNHMMTLLPVGNGKAITRVFRKDLVNAAGGDFGGYVIEHWLVDLVGKSAKKMDIPLSAGDIGKIMDLGNNQYAIPCNTQDGVFFYIYSSSTGAVTKGAKYIGGTFANRTFIRLQ